MLLLDILFLLIATVIIGWKLFKILGQDVGFNERNRSSASSNQNKERHAEIIQETVEQKSHTQSLSFELENSLTDDLKAVFIAIRRNKYHETLTADAFIDGAKKAYSLIQEGIRNKNYDILQSLMVRELYQEWKNLNFQEKNLISINSAYILDAEYKDNQAKIAVAFEVMKSDPADSAQPKKHREIYTFIKLTKEQSKIWYISAIQL